MTATSDIATFVARLPGLNVPAAVAAEVDISFADTVASMLAGVPMDAARIVASSPLHQTTGPLSATLVGFGGRRSLLDTALVHGVLAHVADYDDVSWGLMGHPSATIVPALLPLAEVLGSSGDELTRAYLAGYETAVELGHATAPGHYLRGWHATATIGVIGVAAAGAALLALDRERTVHALGIAASSASGLRQNFGSSVKSLHCGFAARNGLEAALLARDGYTADAEAIDGRWGFFRAFDDAENGRLREKAFDGWNILDPGTLRKQYPSCGATHQAIDATREIVRRRPTDWREVTAVEVAVAPACFAPLRSALPTTPLEGKFSMPFTVATALAEGEVRTRHFTDAYLASQPVQTIMPLVSMVASDALAAIPENSNEATAAQVVVSYRDGTVETAEVHFPSGAPENPLSADDLRAKFLDAAGPVLPEGRAEELAELLRSVRALPSITPVLELLVP